MANSKKDNILNEIKLLHDYLSMQMKRIKKSKEKKKKNPLNTEGKKKKILKSASISKLLFKLHLRIFIFPSLSVLDVRPDYL